MMEPIRPVDQAMQADRPPKKTMRNLWVERYKEVSEAHPDSDIPYYLTLSGADGKDIELIIASGLISMTEINGIAEKDQNRIVAVERSDLGIAKLQRKFVGLRIKQANFQNLVRGEGQFSWPEGEDIECCRARIINLDLDEPLTARIEDNKRIVFPVLEWIRKLCAIHSKHPRLDWTLCLTLHGETHWPNEVNDYIRKFLVENFVREPEFANKTKEFLGDELFDRLNGESIDFQGLGRDVQQKLIMAIVPKIINQLVHNEGWKVQTEYNLRYGGGENAPMATWIIRFSWDGQQAATPDALYRASLREIYDGLGRILDDGELQMQ